MASFKELLGYKKSFQLALDIHNITKKFPKEEQYSLTSQIRKSSRSVCINMAEGFRKTRYKAHFISKMTDADMENSETQVWLEFSLAFNYISLEEIQNLIQQSEEVGRLLNHVIENRKRILAIFE